MFNLRLIQVDTIFSLIKKNPAGDRVLRGSHFVPAVTVGTFYLMFELMQWQLIKEIYDVSDNVCISTTALNGAKKSE